MCTSINKRVWPCISYTYVYIPLHAAAEPRPNIVQYAWFISLFRPDICAPNQLFYRSLHLFSMYPLFRCQQSGIQNWKKNKLRYFFFGLVRYVELRRVIRDKHPLWRVYTYSDMHARVEWFSGRVIRNRSVYMGKVNQLKLLDKFVQLDAQQGVYM